MLPLRFTSLCPTLFKTNNPNHDLFTLNFPVSFSSRIQFAKVISWILIAFVGPVLAFCSSWNIFLSYVTGGLWKLSCQETTLCYYITCNSVCVPPHALLFQLSSPHGPAFCKQTVSSFALQVFIDSHLHFRLQQQCKSVGLVLYQTNIIWFFLPIIAVSGELQFPKIIKILLFFTVERHKPLRLNSVLFLQVHWRLKITKLKPNTKSFSASWLEGFLSPDSSEMLV